VVDRRVPHHLSAGGLFLLPLLPFLLLPFLLLTPSSGGRLHVLWPEGDMYGVSAAECAVRMARASAHVVGINCHFDPIVSLECLKLMKAGLEAAGLEPHLMVQPLAFHTPDSGKQVFIDLPEFPFALEPRICTRRSASSSTPSSTSSSPGSQGKR